MAWPKLGPFAPFTAGLLSLYYALWPNTRLCWTAVSSLRVTSPPAVGTCGNGRRQGMVVMSQITGPPPLQPGPPPTPPAAAHRAWYKRPSLIIPLALVLAAAVAAALFLALRPTTITASGTVIDRLTGQPVAAASLHGGGKSAITNARGKFQIAGIATDTTLRVSARYYAPAQVKAAQTPVTVRLAPVPVPVAVTSALTGRPLPAALVMPNGDRVQARADGTATLYRIGPGETVTVRAAGYLPAHPAVGADHMVKVALAPTLPTMRAQLQEWYRTRDYQAMIDWMLSPATGYTFTGTSAGDWAQANKQMANDPATAYIGGGTASDGTGVTIQISRPGWSWDAAEIVRTTVGGPPMHPVTLAGQRAWHGGPDSHHVFTTMWSYGPALVSANGADQHRVDAVMTGIIKAMTGTGQGT